jgi:capsular polysaccharide biosynthesis protein
MTSPDNPDSQIARAPCAPIASMTVVPQEPIVGPSLEEASRSGRALETLRLAEPVEIPRCALSFRTPGPYPLAPYGFAFDDPGFRVYPGQEFVACRLGGVTLPGNSGVILHDGVALSDTVKHLMPGWPGSNVEAFVQERSVRFHKDLPVTRRVTDGRFFVAFTASWRNYAHWLQECVPNLVAFVDARRRDPSLKAITPRFAPGSFQQQTLALLGILPEMLFELDPDDVVTFDEAWIPSHADLWGALPHVVASAARLADGVFQHFAPGELGGEGRGERIYLSRRSATRTVANFPEVKALVERHGFEIVEPEACSVAQQIAMMRRARHVIAEHGAGMANILFCRPGASVLELFNPSCVQPEFWSIASAHGLRFGFLVGDHPPGLEITEPDWHANYTIPTETLEEAIRALVAELPAADAADAASVGLAREGRPRLDPHAATAPAAQLRRRPPPEGPDWLGRSRPLWCPSGTGAGMKRNLIMGFCTGYAFETIESFVASALATSERNEICLFTNGMDERFYHVAARLGIRIEDASSYIGTDYHQQNARHFAYRKFLYENGAEYDRVLLVDIRDVFFQSDPFAIRHPRPVCFSLEDTKIMWETWNQTWLRDLYGEELLLSISENYVSCCGTLLGTAGGLTRYLDLLCNELESRDYDRKKIYDQGAHNYIVWKLKPEWGWVDRADSFVSTVGCTNPAHIEIIDDCVVIDGKVPPVVHQWDRHDVLKEHVAASPHFKIKS